MKDSVSALFSVALPSRAPALNQSASVCSAGKWRPSCLSGSFVLPEHLFPGFWSNSVRTPQAAFRVPSLQWSGNTATVSTCFLSCCNVHRSYLWRLLLCKVCLCGRFCKMAPMKNKRRGCQSMSANHIMMSSCHFYPLTREKKKVNAASWNLLGGRVHYSVRSYVSRIKQQLPIMYSK